MGVSGNSPGGGAAGAATYTGARAGATGGAGQVVIVYTSSFPSLNVPASGNNSVACGTNTNIFDNGGAGGNYTDNNNGYAVLNNGGNGVINLSGTYNTEATYDFLKIYSGTGQETLLASYSGSGTIATINSAPGDPLTVQFTSDVSNVASGISLTAAYSGSCTLPVISSTSPVSSCVGQSITITGANFTNTISSLSFGGVAATTFAYVNATTITATVPAGAASGPISITDASGSGSSQLFIRNLYNTCPCCNQQWSYLRRNIRNLNCKRFSTGRYSR